MKIYNCNKVVLTPPNKFIRYNIDSHKFKTSVQVDACIADEIKELWSLGIRTMGCCCGHGKYLGFIEVLDEDIKKMESLGYVHYIYEDEFGGIERQDAFIPKIYGHVYEGYSDGFIG